MRFGWVGEIRGRVPRGWRIALGLVPIVAIFFVWWFITSGEIEERMVSPIILPSPGEVFSGKMIGELFEQRNLLDHVFLSLKRIVLGYLLAVAIALPLGVLMGTFCSALAALAPTTTASGYIPIVTLVPLTMVWFGIGETQKVVFLALAFGVYLLPMVVRAIANVPETYLRTGYTLGANRLQTVFRVLIPIALPDIWHAMRLAFGVGWTYLVLTEMVVLAGGLGALVVASQRRPPREHIYLVIIVITLIAWVSDLLWGWIGRLIFPYRKENS